MLFWSLRLATTISSSPEPHAAQWNRGAYLVKGWGIVERVIRPVVLPITNWVTARIAVVSDRWRQRSLACAESHRRSRKRARALVRARYRGSFLRTGHGAGAVAFGAMAPVIGDSTQYMSDADREAIAAYLKSLPPHGTYGSFDNGARARVQTARSIQTGEVERHGAGIYLSFCARCHRPDGTGQPGKVAALAGNPLLLAQDPTSVMRIVIEGSKSPTTVSGPKPEKMPGFHDQLTSRQIAEVVSFVRSTWGNHAAPVSDRDVEDLRSKIHK